MIDELFEYGVYLALLVALAIPLSAYLNKVMAGQKTVLSRVLVPVENAVYRCIRVDKSEDMGWKRYLVSAFAFSAICLVGLFAILMLQGLLPFNPEGLPGLSWDLAFNTAVSFVTNTNWQAYSGESALSYFSQAIGLPRKLLGRCDARGAVRAHPAVACGDDDRRAAGLAAEFQRVRDGAAAGAGRRDR